LPQDGETTCVHFWNLSEPVEGISHGICRRCGRERDFKPKLREDVPPKEVLRIVGTDMWRTPALSEE